MASKVIIVNTPGIQGPVGPPGIYDGQVTSASFATFAATASAVQATSPLILTGSASTSGSFWNAVTPEFQVVSDPTYLTNHFFLVKNDYTTLRIGTLSSDTGLTLITQATTALSINNNTNDIFLLTNQGVAYFTTQSTLPLDPLTGGLIFSGSDFFVAT